jgi:hypothetical protein
MAWFMDLELARRIERAEGAIATTFAAVHQRLDPGRGAAWREVGGTFAIYDGTPLSQTLGLGLTAPVTPELLGELEAFFESRGAAVAHEVSPLAGVEVLALLVARGYAPCELSTVLIRELDAPLEPPAAAGLRARPIEPADRPTWIATSIAGWATDPDNAPIVASIAQIVCHNDAMLHFLVERDGAPIATGSLGFHDGVALLAGASTVADGRGAGAQTLLLATRLAEAQRRGCALALMAATPGSASQRNAERRGFRVAYTRTKWRRDARGDESSLHPAP